MHLVSKVLLVCQVHRASLEKLVLREVQGRPVRGVNQATQGSLENEVRGVYLVPWAHLDHKVNGVCQENEVYLEHKDLQDHVVVLEDVDHLDHLETKDHRVTWDDLVPLVLLG